MSFSTKSSQDTRGARMSLHTNVTFKTIALFGTHDGAFMRSLVGWMHVVLRLLDRADISVRR
jgi:hypothetical protein